MKLDGEPLDGEALDLPADRLDGGVLQVGQPALQAPLQLWVGAEPVATRLQCYTAPVALGAVGIPDPSGADGL